MLTVLSVLVVLNLIGIGVLFYRSNQSQDFSFLSQEIKPLSDKMLQLEVIIQQRFENQKEVTRLQVSEIIEDKFKKIAGEQNKTSQDLIEKFGNFQHVLTQQLVAVNEKLTQELVAMNSKMTGELVGMKEKMGQELVVMNEKITKSMQEKLN